MKIKVHEREKKAMIRFQHPAEVDWFKRHMAFIRDSDPRTHPPISLKDEMGAIRYPLPKPMPPVSGTDVVQKPIVVKKEEINGK